MEHLPQPDQETHTNTPQNLKEMLQREEALREQLLEMDESIPFANFSEVQQVQMEQYWDTKDSSSLQDFSPEMAKAIQEYLSLQAELNLLRDERYKQEVESARHEVGELVHNIDYTHLFTGYINGEVSDSIIDKILALYQWYYSDSIEVPYQINSIKSLVSSDILRQNTEQSQDFVTRGNSVEFGVRDILNKRNIELSKQSYALNNALSENVKLAHIFRSPEVKDYINTVNVQISRLRSYVQKFMEAQWSSIFNQALGVVLSSIQDEMIQAGILEGRPLQIKEQLTPEEFLQVTTFEGWEECTEDEAYIMTQEEIAYYLTRKISSDVLQKVKKIIFLDPKESVDMDDDQHKEWITVGSISNVTFEKAELQSAEITIRLPYKVNKSKFKQSRAVDFAEILLHECAHILHSTLPMTLVEEWVKLHEQDRNFLSSYTIKSMDDSVARGIREDFCESFMTYISSPYVTKVVFPKRYEFFQRYIVDYYPEQQKILLLGSILQSEQSIKDLFAMNGFTDKDIIQKYRFTPKEEISNP